MCAGGSSRCMQCGSEHSNVSPRSVVVPSGVILEARKGKITVE